MHAGPACITDYIIIYRASLGASERVAPTAWRGIGRRDGGTTDRKDRRCDGESLERLVSGMRERAAPWWIFLHFVLAVSFLPAPAHCRARRKEHGVKQQIRQIYREYNPKKLNTLPDLFVKYNGNEQELLDAVKEKYHINNDPDTGDLQSQHKPSEEFDVDGRIHVIDELLTPEHQNILAGAWRHAPYSWGEQDSPSAEPAGTVLELELDDAAVRTVSKRLGKLGDLGLKVTGSATGGQGWVSPEELTTWVPWCAPSYSPLY